MKSRFIYDANEKLTNYGSLEGPIPVFDYFYLHRRITQLLNIFLSL